MPARPRPEGGGLQSRPAAGVFLLPSAAVRTVAPRKPLPWCVSQKLLHQGVVQGPSASEKVDDQFGEVAGTLEADHVPDVGHGHHPSGGNLGREPGGGREYLLDVELADHHQRRHGDPRQWQVRWLPFGSRLGVGGKVVREHLASHPRQPLTHAEVDVLDAPMRSGHPEPLAELDRRLDVAALEQSVFIRRKANDLRRPRLIDGRSRCRARRSRATRRRGPRRPD
jgi:hypothetical protein